MENKKRMWWTFKAKHSFSVVGLIDIWENLQAVNNYKILNNNFSFY